MKIIGVKHALAVTGVMSGIIAGVFAAMPTANASGGDEVRYLTDVKEGTFYGSPQAQSVWPGDDVILQAEWRCACFGSLQSGRAGPLTRRVMVPTTWRRVPRAGQ